MLGTIINASAIIAASLLGLMLRKGIPDKMSQTITEAMGLVLIVIGIQSGLQYESIPIVLISLVVGGIIGEWIDIEGGLARLGEKAERRFSSGDSQFSKAFIASSLLYCTGAMAIMGPLNDGLTGDYSILLVKSLLDGVISVIFTASMGIGVLFSAIPVFIYQGSISLMAEAIKPFLTPAILNNLTSVGGMLILAIGTNMMKLTNIRVANLLPGLVLVPLIMALITLF